MRYKLHQLCPLSKLAQFLSLFNKDKIKPFFDSVFFKVSTSGVEVQQNPSLSIALKMLEPAKHCDQMKVLRLSIENNWPAAGCVRACC